MLQLPVLFARSEGLHLSRHGLEAGVHEGLQYSELRGAVDRRRQILHLRYHAVIDRYGVFETRTSIHTRFGQIARHLIEASGDVGQDRRGLLAIERQSGAVGVNQFGGLLQDGGQLGIGLYLGQF